MASEHYNSLRAHMQQIQALLEEPKIHEEMVEEESQDAGWYIKKHNTEPVFGSDITLADQSCSMFCACSCHRGTKLSYLNPLLVVYRGSVFGPRNCTEKSCKQCRTRFKAQITFYFPLWLVAKVLQLNLKRLIVWRYNALNQHALRSTVRF